MSHQHSDSDHHDSHRSWLYSRTGITIACMLVILGFLIYTGHSAHLLGFIPYLILLACPLMHIFMHGGHHKHNHREEDKNHTSLSSQEHLHDGGCCENGDHEGPKSDSTQ